LSFIYSQFIKSSFILFIQFWTIFNIISQVTNTAVSYH